jgi:putative transcriptional regulator
MTFSFNPLWKLLIDKGMTKEELRVALNLSPSTIAKMGKGENISMSVLQRICKYFNCQPGDLMVYIPNKVDKGGGSDGER